MEHLAAALDVGVVTAEDFALARERRRLRHRLELHHLLRSCFVFCFFVFVKGTITIRFRFISGTFPSCFVFLFRRLHLLSNFSSSFRN